jgi:dihydrofolate reductase
LYRVSAVLSSHSVSLDGFMAQQDGQPGSLHAWRFGGNGAGSLRGTPESREVFDGLVARIGATVVGRTTYDVSDGWGGKLPFDWPFFVVTHRPPEDADELPFVFVTGGLEQAIELAKEAAGDKDVSVMGGDVTKQALSAGLLDELHLDLVPVLFGEGVRFLDDFEEGPVRLERMRLVDTPAVAHVSFRVLRT